MATTKRPEGLHTGKRTNEIKTTITPQMHDLLIERALEVGCSPSELVLDAIYLCMTGMTFQEHVANDRRKAFAAEVRQLGADTHSTESS